MCNSKQHSNVNKKTLSDKIQQDVPAPLTPTTSQLTEAHHYNLANLETSKLSSSFSVTCAATKSVMESTGVRSFPYTCGTTCSNKNESTLTAKRLLGTLRDIEAIHLNTWLDDEKGGRSKVSTFRLNGGEVRSNTLY